MHKLLPVLLLSTLIVEAGFLFIEKGASTLLLIMDWKIGFFILALLYSLF